MSDQTPMAPDWTAQAHANGHDLVPDGRGWSMGDIIQALEARPQRGVNVSRWTCRTCGSAVLKPKGVVYGSAHTEVCQSSGGWGDRTQPWLGGFPAASNA